MGRGFLSGSIWDVFVSGVALVAGRMILFYNFLFYRIMSAALFDDPLTIWGSAITAIVVTMIMALSGPITIPISSEEKEERISFNYSRMFVGVSAACGISCLAAYLIALGFSDRLYSDISYWSRYNNLFEQDIFWFCIMVSIPVVVHLFLFFLRIRDVE